MRPYAPTGRPDHRHFNPRIPYGMRHELAHIKRDRRISIHASRMGCDIGNSRKPLEIKISIHASRMGCDDTRRQDGRPQVNFNPRIPYGMRRQVKSVAYPKVHFNPRIPYGMRPVLAISDGAHKSNFNPRIPYGMRPCGSGRHDAKKGFQSTHPVWDVTMLTTTETATRLFQSTHPVWDATKAVKNVTSNIVISIHASRMGCDCFRPPSPDSRS